MIAESKDVLTKQLFQVEGNDLYCLIPPRMLMNIIEPKWKDAFIYIIQHDKNLIIECSDVGSFGTYYQNLLIKTLASRELKMGLILTEGNDR